MSRAMTKVTRTGAALAMTGALVSASVATSTVASAAPKGTVLHIAITDHRMYVDGPTTFPAGRVKLYVDASGDDRGAEIIRLHQGYSFKDYRHDLKIAFNNLFAPSGDTDKGLKHLNKAIDHTTWGFGGIYAPKGKVRHGTVLLKRPSTRYVLFDDSGNLPKHPVHLTVTAPVGPQTLPNTDATIRAKSNHRFGGDRTLPAGGDIKFKNISNNSPHFLELAHVTEDTSRQDVLDSFESDQEPDFVLPGLQDTDVVAPGHAMTVHLSVPKGKYAVMCFFPDPEEGTPHAVMGMVRMVHVE